MAANTAQWKLAECFVHAMEVGGMVIKDAIQAVEVDGMVGSKLWKLAERKHQTTLGPKIKQNPGLLIAALPFFVFDWLD